MKLVFVLVDALKNSYIQKNSMPFLWEFCSRNTYYSAVVPSPGFCERSEIFTGLSSFESGNCTAIGYLPENSDYQKDRLPILCFRMLNKIQPKVARRLFSKYCWMQKKQMKPYLIPYSILNNFALTEDGKEQIIACNDIFDVLSEKGYSYSTKGFTSLASSGQISFDSIYEFIKSEMAEKVDFLPIYIGEADSKGHEYGGDINKMEPTLIKIDKLLKKINELAIDNDYVFAVLGDHGMVPVKKNIDVSGIIKKTGLKNGKDYLMFLDSTIARFWFFSDIARDKIIACCNNELSELGKIITRDNYQEYEIPLDVLSKQGKPVYGDMMWCANPGVLIAPDFFNPKTKIVRGMHGYLETDMVDGVGMFTCNNDMDKRKEVFYLKDICGELCKILEIPCPNDKSSWRRLINE